MVRTMLVSLLLLWCMGCQPVVEGEYLSPEEFRKTWKRSDQPQPLILPGSSVRVAVAEDNRFDGEFLVQPDGIIELNLVGQLEVGGKTAEELEQIIAEKLEQDFIRNPTVRVKLIQNEGPGLVYVMGMVNRPGPVALPANRSFTVLQAITAVGGCSQFGNCSKIQVLRYAPDGKKYRTVINLDLIIARGQFEKDIPLMNGDWLIVPQKPFNF